MSVANIIKKFYRLHFKTHACVKWTHDYSLTTLKFHIQGESKYVSRLLEFFPQLNQIDEKQNFTHPENEPSHKTKQNLLQEYTTYSILYKIQT